MYSKETSVARCVREEWGEAVNEGEQRRNHRNPQSTAIENILLQRILWVLEQSILTPYLKGRKQTFMEVLIYPRPTKGSRARICGARRTQKCD